MNVQEAVKRVEIAAKRPRADVRDGSKVAVGKVTRQGDVYLMRTDRAPTRGDEIALSVGVIGRQIVPGTTPGSRHVVVGDAVAHCAADVGAVTTQIAAHAKQHGCKASVREEMLYGAIEVGPSGASLTHPEHAHVRLPPDSCWIAWSQYDESTQRRVAD